MNEMAMAGWLIHCVLCSMNAQVVAAITARVISTKPSAMEREISSSSVPSGGRR